MHHEDPARTGTPVQSTVPATSVRARPRLRAQLIWASVAVAALMVAGPVVFLRTWHQETRANLTHLTDSIPDLFQQDVTHHFFSSVSEAREGQLLELATLRTTESMSETLSRSWLGIGVHSSVRVDAPVIYRYGVGWASGWKITLTPAGEGGVVCLVEAPALEPFQPPAVDTAELRIHTQEALLGPRVAASRDRLVRQLTPRARALARSSEYRSLVRELARRRLVDYVEQWLLSARLVDPAALVNVYARFADDRPDAPGAPVVQFREISFRSETP